MTDVDDWGYDWDDDEPLEPDWGDVPPPIGRERRRVARRWSHQRRVWRKTGRHAKDRFWQARNRTAFDEEAPF